MILKEIRIKIKNTTIIIKMHNTGLTEENGFQENDYLIINSTFGLYMDKIEDYYKMQEIFSHYNMVLQLSFISNSRVFGIRSKHLKRYGHAVKLIVSNNHNITNDKDDFSMDLIDFLTLLKMSYEMVKCSDSTYEIKFDHNEKYETDIAFTNNMIYITI